LEHIINAGHARERVFEDWLDLMLSAHLSLTDNYFRAEFPEKLKAKKLDGPYEKRYMEIVSRYADKEKMGERAIDYFTKAHTNLIQEIREPRHDILGEIYMGCITFGQHGQFFTPGHISEAMAKIVSVKSSESVLDPCCGSGIMLIEAGKECPDARFTGIDLDPRCAKMCALNMLFFDLNATVILGNALINQYHRQWTIHKGGFIYESEVNQKVAAAVSNAVDQQELFAEQRKAA
jgi:type I restriction-modification system DNA methylase subunit